MSFKKFLLEQVSLGDFWDMLSKHDWHYEHSDAHNVYTKGRDSLERLNQIAAQSEEYRELMKQFQASVMSRSAPPGRPA